MARDGVVTAFESEIYRRDKSRIWISENARGVLDGGGALLYYEGTAPDITQRKLAEKELDRSRLQLERAHADSVMLLAAAAEANDPTTGRHLQRVSALSELLALEVGFTADDARAVALAALLHDIGKIRVPDRILNKPGALEDREREVMELHTVWGSEFLAGRVGFELAEDVARSHHERWDGGGYPTGLAGAVIPIAAAIVSVADSFDAITNDRPYRAGRPIDAAGSEIVSSAGRQFNPAIAPHSLASTGVAS
jgi:putative nucleotidyltransferase with HDIG domain